LGLIIFIAIAVTTLITPQFKKFEVSVRAWKGEGYSIKVQKHLNIIGKGKLMKTSSLEL